MDIVQVKLLNDERAKALEQLKLLHNRDKEFDKAWNKKLKDATDKFVDEFITFFQGNGWKVKETSYGNRTITVTYGMDSYVLNSINDHGITMSIETGKNYKDMHFFKIGQKKDDPNYIKRDSFEVNYKTLTNDYSGEPHYEEFLKKFTTVADLKQVEEEAQKFMLQVDNFFELIENIEFHIVPTDKESFYDSAEDYINSL